MDILSYIIGMKNGSGGELPEGITKIACGTETITNAPSYVITHNLGTDKHNLIFFRTETETPATDLCAKFATEGLPSSIVYTIAGAALDTSDNIHLTTVVDILEAYGSTATFNGTYNWIAWY